MRRRLERFLSELKRRHVFRVAVAYAAAAIAVVSVASDFLPALRLPEWTVTLVAIATVIGFPLAILFAWIYDITPRGVVRTPEVADPDADAGPVGAGVRAARLVGLAMLLAVIAVGALFVLDALPFDGGRRDGGSIAVLPFASVSDSPEDDVFSMGIHEEVMTQLYRIDGIAVISRTSVMQYRDAPKSVRQVGQELGVSSVLEASVRRAGDRVRIDVRLIDAASERQIWADSYDRELTDVLWIQTDIATQIAMALQVRLSPATRTQLARAGAQAVDATMYDAYLRGLYEAAEGRHETAISEFRRALDIDSSYGPAYAGMARSYYVRAFFGELSPAEAFDALHEAATQALKLDLDLADAHAMLALYDLHYAWDWRNADARFRRALALSPNHAQVRHDYAHYLLAMGRTGASVDESVRAVRLDPGNGMLKACAGWHDFTDREYANAVAQATGALMMTPGAWWPEIILGWGYLHQNQNGPALASLRSAVANSHGASFAVASLAQGLAHAGERTPARRMLESLVASADTRYISAYDVAAVQAALGDTSAALLWLQKAFEERSAMLIHVGWDPRFDRLRGEPAFRAILAAMQLPDRPPPKTGTLRRNPVSM